MTDRPLVSIIIVATNMPRLLCACLGSVIRHTTVPHEIIVVSNGRSKKIDQCFEKFKVAHVIQASKNTSYTFAANQGALKSRGEYLCFLNSPALVGPGWLSALLNAAKKPGVGAVTSVGCVLIPRVVMMCVGLFDERFSLGFNNHDYLMRLRLRGYHLKILSNKHPHLQELSYSTSNVHNAPNRFLRAGFSMTSQDTSKIHALVSLGKLDRFEPDDLSRSMWSLLDGAQSAKKMVDRLHRAHPRLSKIDASEVRRRLNAFLRSDLIKKIKPFQPDSVKVTVMMPVHNAQTWLGEAIASVLAQRYRDFELIIADDASTDQTAFWAHQYASWHPQVRFIQNTYQLGIPKTRNQILKTARGKYIAVCDADDLVRPTWLKRFVHILESQPNVGWVYGDRLNLRSNNQSVFFSPAIPMNGHREFKHNIMQHSGALIRRQLLLDLGGYDESFGSTEDYDLALRASRRAKILALSGEIHHLYRHHSENTSRTNPWAAQETQDLIHRAKKAAIR